MNLSLIKKKPKMATELSRSAQLLFDPGRASSVESTRSNMSLCSESSQGRSCSVSSQEQETKMQSYDSLHLSTRTIGLIFNKRINPRNACILLPIVRVPDMDVKTKRKKIKLECETPGLIIAINGYGLRRGLVRSKSTKSQNNCTQVDISAKAKVVGVGLYSTELHFLGGMQDETIHEVCGYILNYLLEGQRYCEMMKNEESRDACIMWILESVRVLDSPIVCIDGIPITPEYTVENVMSMNGVFSIPSHLNKELTMFLLSHMKEMKSYDQCLDFARYVRSMPDICDPNLCIEKYRTDMINYNFRIPFSIKRMKFANLINGYENFECSHVNATSKKVSVKLPYPSEKKGKPVTKYYTFTVCKGGSVTYSGPDEVTMRDVYGLFVKFIEENTNEIRDV